MAQVGRLSVAIDADSSGLKRGINDATSAVTTAAGDITQQARNIAGAIGAYMSADLFIGFIKGSADAAAQIDRLSERTGIAVESLSALNYAANINGVSIQDLDGALKGLANKMLEAQMGSGEAAEVFKALGISVVNASGSLRATEDVLLDMADAFQGMQDGAGKAALSQKLMEDAGVALIPVLNQGSDGLRKMREEAQSLGVVLDEQTSRRAVEFNNNLVKLSATATALGQSIANKLIPSINELIDEFLAGTKHANGFWDALGTFGTINPFRDLAGNLKASRAEIDELTAARERYIKSGADTRSIDTALEAERKRLEYLKEIERQQAINAAAAIDAGDAITRAMGGDTRRAAPSLPMAGAAAADGAAKGVAQKGDPLADWITKQEEADSAYWAGRIAKIQEGLLTEQELMVYKYEQDLARLDAAMISEQERLAAKEALTLEHLDRMAVMDEEAKAAQLEREEGLARLIEQSREKHLTNLEKFNAMSWEDQAMSVAGALSSQLTSVKTTSRAMFEVQKAANIASAIMTTYAGANRALNDYPAPWSYVVAATTIAAGLARVAAIRSQTFGGATAAAGGGGGVSASAVGGVSATTGMAPAANQNIVIQGIGAGDLFSGDAVRGLIDKLNDAQRNGARVVVA